MMEQKPQKQRLDLALVERGLVESRARAQALIMAGKVFSGDKKLEKAGIAILPDQPIEVRGQDHPYVSRGGVKLAKALDHFQIDPAGQIAVDVGSSTGGFTDVILQRGAAKVYAVDVGTNQLAWKLRNDPRVVVMEQTNARHLTGAHFADPFTLIVTDVSFISLTLALPATLNLAEPGARFVALIKPQFEAGREQVGKGGIVTDPGVHESVCAKISDWLRQDMGWQVQGLIESPITGQEGNKEFLIAAQKRVD